MAETAGQAKPRDGFRVREGRNNGTLHDVRAEVEIHARHEANGHKRQTSRRQDKADPAFRCPNRSGFPPVRLCSDAATKIPTVAMPASGHTQNAKSWSTYSAACLTRNKFAQSEGCSGLGPAGSKSGSIRRVPDPRSGKGSAPRGLFQYFNVAGLKPQLTKIEAGGQELAAFTANISEKAGVISSVMPVRREAITHSGVRLKQTLEALVAVDPILRFDEQFAAGETDAARRT